MLTQITFYPILGMPLIAWGGLTTFILLLLTAIIAILNSKGLNKWPITYNMHRIMAVITIILGILHGILGILAFIY